MISMQTLTPSVMLENVEIKIIYLICSKAPWITRVALKGRNQSWTPIASPGLLKLNEVKNLRKYGFH